LHVPQQAFLASVVAAGFSHLQAPFLQPQGILHSHFPAGHLQAVLLTFLQVHLPAGHLQAFLQVHLPAGHLQGILLVLQQAPVFVQPPCFRLH
jgi:hypothetical protein